MGGESVVGDGEIVVVQLKLLLACQALTPSRNFCLFALTTPDAERPGAQAEQFRRFVRRHVTGFRPLRLLLFFSHISHLHVQNPFRENKKAPVETKEGHRQNMPCLSWFPRELRVRYFARDARPI